MTDKTEAQPEALRLAARLDCDATNADMGRKPIACTRRRAAAELRRLHAEIQQLKAQLSARQAAPLCYLHVAATIFPDSGYQVCSSADAGAFPVYAAAPHQPEREPQRHDENRELAETAMRFVDRAGDVHPGIDDADRICAEFHAAMMEVIEKWHPMPMPPGIGATND